MSLTMRQIIHMHNRLVDKLNEINSGVLKMMENQGAINVGHESDDNNLVCFSYHDQMFGIKYDQWFIDGDEVPFELFLATIAQE